MIDDDADDGANAAADNSCGDGDGDGGDSDSDDGNDDDEDEDNRGVKMPSRNSSTVTADRHGMQVARFWDVRKQDSSHLAVVCLKV